MSIVARDVMQRTVGIIDAGASLAELERAFEEAGVSGFPVVDGGRVVGVV
jgi:CBS domain-containing protein